MIVLLFNSLYSIEIKSMPIKFSQKRVDLTKEYINKRYGLSVDSIKIIPKIIVIHHTDEVSLKKSFDLLNNETLDTRLKYLKNASTLNVSAHYLVDRDGTIYSLMDDNIMARHIIGLNYYSIGIENVGGNKEENALTKAQLEANIKLVEYLKNKYKTIEYLIGHYQYKDFANHPLFLEKNSLYRTVKTDPSIEFMSELRSKFKDLKSHL